MDTFMNYIGLDAKCRNCRFLMSGKIGIVRLRLQFIRFRLKSEKNKLMVKVENAAWRYELSLRKEEIIKKAMKN